MTRDAAFGGTRLDLEVRGERQRSQQAIEDVAEKGGADADAEQVARA